MLAVKGEQAVIPGLPVEVTGEVLALVEPQAAPQPFLPAIGGLVACKFQSVTAFGSRDRPIGKRKVERTLRRHQKAMRLRLVAGDVRLTPVDEQTLEPLLSVAIAETEPHEVMPPVKAPAGWSQMCRKAFREFYRSSYGGLDGPTRTLMYAIICGGDVVGMIRMARRDEPDTMETGMWVGQEAWAMLESTYSVKRHLSSYPDRSRDGNGNRRASVRTETARSSHELGATCCQTELGRTHSHSRRAHSDTSPS